MGLLAVLVVGAIAFVVVTSRAGRESPRPEVRAVAAATGARGVRSELRIAKVIGRAEARRLARNPAVLLAIVPSTLALLFGEGSAPRTDFAVAFTPVAAFPLAGLTLIAVNLAVLRPRRLGTAELIETAPATARARTIGHLFSLAAPMAIMVGLLGVAAVAFLVADPTAGQLHVAYVWELLTGVVLVGCGGACGVLLARWLPSAALAPLAVVGLGALEGLLAATPQPETNRLRWLAWFVPQPENLPADLWPRESAWHLIYLLGLGAVVVVVALLRHGVTRPLLAGLAMSLGVVGATGVVQVQPMTEAEIDHAVSWLEDPERHQRCRSHERVTTCAYPDHDFSSEWRTVADGVLSALPAGVVGPVTVEQQIGASTWEKLPPEVRRRVDLRVLIARHEVAALRPELRWGVGEARGSTELVLGALLAAHAVGLGGDRPDCYVGGQARGVVLLWLAGQTTERAGGVVRATAAGAHGELYSDAFEMLERGEDADEWLYPLFPRVGTDYWVMDASVPFVWSVADFDLAAQLLEQPRAEVVRVLHRDWDDFTSPDAGADRVAASFGLTMAAPHPAHERALAMPDVLPAPCR